MIPEIRISDSASDGDIAELRESLYTFNRSATGYDDGLALSCFLRDEDGRRPVYGGTEIFQRDPHWRDLILFYEYFHGDNGAGIGASHQTGWTGLVATMIDLFAQLDASQFLERGKRDAFETIVGEPGDQGPRS